MASLTGVAIATKEATSLLRDSDQFIGTSLTGVVTRNIRQALTKSVTDRQTDRLTDGAQTIKKCDRQTHRQTGTDAQSANHKSPPVKQSVWMLKSCLAGNKAGVIN
ncbi:hypothetical protein DPMN_175918 [Dreissena polymorpha]|uniref:Uncharacterized protein n=1 Tax=Dreissena polymorpha TaxID=45954 RepID=A0A9D4E959_DREPO|nr:hypothetical protein DPMN_175918 [Dreissena polymorpha]